MAIMRAALAFILVVTILHVIGSTTAAPAQADAEIDAGVHRERRDLKEMWEKVKDYFKDLQIDLKEKYAKFGEWVKNVLSKSLEKGKSKMENIKNIAKEFIDHTKGVSKEVAIEALEFLKPYKEDLGSLWDQVKETVKDIVNRSE